MQYEQGREVRDLPAAQDQGGCVPVVQCFIHFAEIGQCDEQYPTCGQCVKRNRPCHYAPSRIRKLRVTLVEPPDEAISFATGNAVICLDARPPHTDEKTIFPISRSGKPAESGEEVFFRTIGASSVLPLQCRRSPNERYHSVSPQLYPHVSRPEDLLRAQLVGLVEPKPISQNPYILWGKWLMLIAPQLGTSPALDDATLCVIHALVTRYSRTAENGTEVRGTYGLALSSVRAAVGSPDPEIAFSNETIAATRMLTAVEVSCLIPMYRQDLYMPRHFSMSNLAAV
jgi:hypothetical protein